MPTSPTNTYTSGAGLQPFFKPDLAYQEPVRLAASTTFSQGELLGELVGNNEKISLVIDATGGTFTLTYGTETAALAWNASAAAVQAALEALASVGTGNVSVTKVQNRYTLTMADGTDGGTFALRIRRNGITRTIHGIAWDVASTTTLDAAIEALDIIGTGGVAVTGTAGQSYSIVFLPSLGEVTLEVFNDVTNDGGVLEGGITLLQNAAGAYVIEFINDLGNTNIGTISTTATSLTGGAGTATVAVITQGSAGTPGIWHKYSASATNGRQLPRCILQHACITDSDSNIYYGSVASGDKVQAVPAWFGGIFLTSDVPALTEAALTAMGGKMISGSIAGGGKFQF